MSGRAIASRSANRLESMHVFKFSVLKLSDLSFNGLNFAKFQERVKMYLNLVLFESPRYKEHKSKNELNLDFWLKRLKRLKYESPKKKQVRWPWWPRPCVSQIVPKIIQL